MRFSFQMKKYVVYLYFSTISFYYLLLFCLYEKSESVILPAKNYNM